jgi:hypothetical protein
LTHNALRIFRRWFNRTSYPRRFGGAIRQIEALIVRNQHLKEARYILLPRLTTGVIDVEKRNLIAFENENTEQMLIAEELETPYAS